MYFIKTWTFCERRAKLFDYKPKVGSWGGIQFALHATDNRQMACHLMIITMKNDLQQLLASTLHLLREDLSRKEIRSEKCHFQHRSIRNITAAVSLRTLLEAISSSVQVSAS